MLRSLLVLSLLSLSSALVAGPVVAVAPSVSRVTSSPSMIALTKPQRTNQRRRAYNKMYKSEMKTAIKRVSPAARLARARPGVEGAGDRRRIQADTCAPG
eukprot:scaffold237324_cov19-Tisochrysis_lutea.AAC.1